MLAEIMKGLVASNNWGLSFEIIWGVTALETPGGTLLE